LLFDDEKRKTVKGGYRRDIPKRMELKAVIAGLEPLKQRFDVTLFTDSNYVLKGMSGKRSAQVGNRDLWKRLLYISSQQSVTFKATLSTKGNPVSTRCEQLAIQAALEPNLPWDVTYEGPIPQPCLFGPEDLPVPEHVPAG
jgi:ribonuclease HI